MDWLDGHPHVAKVRVVGSNPVFRSKYNRRSGALFGHLICSQDACMCPWDAHDVSMGILPDSGRGLKGLPFGCRWVQVWVAFTTFDTKPPPICNALHPTRQQPSRPAETTHPEPQWPTMTARLPPNHVGIRILRPLESEGGGDDERGGSHVYVSSLPPREAQQQRLPTCETYNVCATEDASCAVSRARARSVA